MIEVENILISLDTRHAQNIYDGAKKIELRRREVRANVGDVIWIYEKVPVGAITGSARIKAVHVASPIGLWRLYGALSGVSRAEFFKYFAGLDRVCAIELTKAHKLNKPVPLITLRAIVSNFQPPQFFVRLRTKLPILAALHAANNSLSLSERPGGDRRLRRGKQPISESHNSRTRKTSS